MALLCFILKKTDQISIKWCNSLAFIAHFLYHAARKISTKPLGETIGTT